MNGEDTLKDIYSTVIRTEEAVESLKKQEEIHRLHCEDHDKRITRLEICGGPDKGYFRYYLCRCGYYNRGSNIFDF